MDGTRFTEEDAEKLLAENPRCVVIPEGVTSFMRSPFADNTEIEEIHLPKSIMGIGTAFQNNEKLTRVEYAGTVAEWEKVTGIYELLETSAKIVKCSDGEWEVPTLHIGSSYKGGKYLKKCAKFAESVVIPSDVEEICGNAFSGCKKIKSLTIPESVKTIRSANYDGHFAFDRMESLEEIEIPATVESFEAKFCGCASLKAVRMKFTQKELYSSTFRCVQSKMEKDENGKLHNVRTERTCPSLETVELPVVETIKKCLKDLPSLKRVIFPDELGSLDPLDIVSIPESAEIVVGENAKIGKATIEKDGKPTAEIIYAKKTGRLLAVRTKETRLALPDFIKQIEPNCFPPSVIELSMSKSLKKIKFPKKNRYGDYDTAIGCSKNLLAFLENYDLSSTDSAKEKAKKEKIATVEAVGAGGLALAELDGLDVETTAVTKPRVGSQLTVKLPYNHSLSFFFPKKQKEEEAAALKTLFAALKAAHDETDSSRLDYLEGVYNAQSGVKSVLQCEFKADTLENGVALCLLDKKLADTGAKIVFEGSFDNSNPYTKRGVVAKFHCGGRFVLFIERIEGKFHSTFSITSDYDDLKNVVLAAKNAESADEIRAVETGFAFRVIDSEAWRA